MHGGVVAEQRDTRVSDPPVRAVKLTETGSLRDFITKRYLSERNKQPMQRGSLFISSVEMFSSKFQEPYFK